MTRERAQEIIDAIIDSPPGSRCGVPRDDLLELAQAFLAEPEASSEGVTEE